MACSPVDKKNQHVRYKKINCTYFWLILTLCFIPFQAQSQNPDITHIYTNYNGGWSSGVGALNSTPTDDSSILLGFTVDETTYSTGVNNTILENLLGTSSYEDTDFRALPVEEVQPGGNTFIGIPYKWQGVVQEGGGSNSGYETLPYQNYIYYLTDGEQGLDLGTAVFNIQAEFNSEYTVESIDANEIGSETSPDIIVTQMGDITGSTDTFRFEDASGQTIGNEVQVTLGEIEPVGESIWAFFDPGTFQYTASQPGNNTPSENTRAIRLRVFDLDDFGLGDPGINLESITAFVHVLGGQSDPAFVGSYNESSITFVLSDLEVTKEISPTGPVSSGNTVTFTVEVTNNGPSDATNVVVEDQLPSGYNFESASTATGSYNSTSGEWNIGSLANGASTTLEIVAEVNASGNYENSATVTGDESDPDQLNNTDTATLASVSLELTGGPCWRMLSSPVDGLTYAEMLDGLWTQGVPGADYEQGASNVFVWDNTVSGSTGGWIPPATLLQEITPGSGFLISVFADDDYDGPEEPEDPFSKTISLLGAAHQSDISPPMNETSNGWTLVGNPYANPISFSALTTDQLTGAAYVYDRNYNGTGGWRSTDTENYGDLIDGVIAPGQGFFVQNDGNGSLTFTEASQTTGGQFYGKQKELHDFVRLELQGQAGVNSLWLRFSDGGSEDAVYGDAAELQPLSEQYALFGSRKSEGTLTDIGHFPMPANEMEIPVSVQATQPGTYSITATDLDLPVGVKLYLHDQRTGKSVPITSSLDYSFTITQPQQAKSTPNSEGIVPCSATPQKAKITGSDRFLISTIQEEFSEEMPQKVMLEQNYPNPFNPATVISYELPQTSQVRLEVFDMIGRQVATLVEGMAEAGEHQINFDASHLTSGIYLYRLTTNGPNGIHQTFTKKFTLIK